MSDRQVKQTRGNLPPPPGGGRSLPEDVFVDWEDLDGRGRSAGAEPEFEPGFSVENQEEEEEDGFVFEELDEGDMESQQ